MTMHYYLRHYPRTLYRVEAGTDRVEVWRGSGWEPTVISVMQLDGLVGDASYRVGPRTWSDSRLS